MKAVFHNHKTLLGNPTFETVRIALSDHYSGLRVELDGPISVRDNSEIFHALIGTSAPLEVAVKHCLVPHTKVPDVLAAKEQFAALKQVSQALANKNEHYRVPTPLHLVPALATFAMSWVDGESLTRKMRRPAVFTSGPGWFEETGAWLGNFHMAGPCRRQLVNLRERITAVGDLYASPLPDKSFANALIILEKATSALERVEADVSWLHGDCKTDNFILCGKYVYGIDISLSYENPVEYDLAQFLNNLDLLLVGPQYLHLIGMRGALEKAFWRGYRTTGPIVSHAYLNWLRLSFSLSFWHTMLAGQKHGIRAWALNRMFAKLTARLARKLT